MIPKIMHQIWLGKKSERPVDLMKTVEDNHKDWEYKLWTEENIGELINKNKYDQVLYDNYCGESKYPKLADIIRYEKLFTYGGVYIDADSKCNKSFNYLASTPFFVAYENEEKCPGIIANGVIGSIPNHVVLKDCIDRIGQLSERAITSKPAFKVTGTMLLTRIIHQSENIEIQIHPSQYFYPVHYSDFNNHTFDEKFEHSYTFQLWNSTIKNRSSIISRASKKLYRMFNWNIWNQ